MSVAGVGVVEGILRTNHAPDSRVNQVTARKALGSEEVSIRSKEREFPHDLHTLKAG